MTKSFLSDYENEFSEIIYSSRIGVEDIEKCGVSKKILAAECLLRSVFGDQIMNNSVEDVIQDSADKKVQKITEEDIVFDSTFKKICDSIENNDFDKNLDELLSKVEWDEQKFTYCWLWLQKS